MTKFPPRSLKRGHQDAATRLKQNLFKDCHPANDNASAEPEKTGLVAAHRRPFVSANDNGQVITADYHISDHLSSGQLSTEAPPFARIEVTGTSLLLYGALVYQYNIALVRRGLETVGRGQGACGDDECPHCAPYIGVPKPVSDLAVLAFLITVDRTSVATWASELKEKLRRYAAWPTADFSVTDRVRRVKLVVRRRTLVTVTRLTKVSRKS